MKSPRPELVCMVPEVKKLLKKLSKCTMEQANNVSKVD